VVTYVDDNLVFTNCETMRLQFAAHCNKRVRFNDDGPARWYLGTQYDRDPNTGAVSASQELYINKLLARWQMSECNATKIPCSGKLDEILTSLQQVFRYLQSRKKIPLKWCAMDNALPGVIHGYADASFADVPDTRLS
jgi:hypothetical protein